MTHRDQHGLKNEGLQSHSHHENVDFERQVLIDSVTWIVKVGSRSLTDDAGRLDPDQIANLATQLVALTQLGKQVVLVSSGAVASGMGKLGLASRPSDLATLQAVAAIGQTHLIQVYEQTFGDNDRLAGMVAGLFHASSLIILSDVRGLYDRDPRDAGAMVLSSVQKIDESIEELVRDRKTGISKGGMASKITTAKFVTHSGQSAVIAWGREPDVLLRLAKGENLGTLFMPQGKALASRKRWIGFSTQPSGSVVVDDGAAAAMKGGGRSLLAIGISDVEGDFGEGEVVSVVNRDRVEIARGLSNYSSNQIRMIRGCRSDRIAQILGQCPYDEVIHRDNLAVV